MKERVLVVDDEPIICMDICQMLESLEYEVIGYACDGFDAVEICRKETPDIVLMDIEMPVFDGLNAAETILNEKIATCVILCTAYADEEFVAQANKIGVAGYLVKPVTARNLKPSLAVAWNQVKKLAESESKVQAAGKKLEESKVIDRAKAILAKEKNILEADAYREMQKLAMQKRVQLVKIAEMVLENDKRKSARNK